RRGRRCRRWLRAHDGESRRHAVPLWPRPRQRHRVSPQRQARESPIVNVVGDQATYHAPLDPPLASDVEGLARPVSQWVKKVTRVEDLGSGAAEAVQAAYAPPGGNATLILPSDVSWNDG